MWPKLKRATERGTVKVSEALYMMRREVNLCLNLQKGYFGAIHRKKPQMKKPMALLYENKRRSAERE